MELQKHQNAVHAAVMAALANVDDPEMGENLVDLRVIGRVLVEGGRMSVSLIPTSATCQMADLMVDEALSAVQRVCPPGTEVVVAMDWDVEWTPQRMAPELRERFGW